MANSASFPTISALCRMHIRFACQYERVVENLKRTNYRALTKPE